MACRFRVADAVAVTRGVADVAVIYIAPAVVSDAGACNKEVNNDVAAVSCYAAAWVQSQ